MRNVKNKKIAITGSIGCGKSFVRQIIQEMGFEVFDVDGYNRSLYLQKAVIDEIKVLFPSAFINDVIDKKRLSQLIFNDSNKKEALENIMLPKIMNEMQHQMRLHPLFIAEVPTLFENQIEDQFDQVIVVSTDESLVIQRLKERGLDEETAHNILNQQMSQTLKIEKADVIFYNNNSKEILKNEVQTWVRENLCI